MSEELLINVSEFETRVALVRDGGVEEIHLARADGYSLTGNVYLGRVVRIVPGMQAAFVDIGLDRPGFLHASDIEDLRGVAEGEAPEPQDIRKLLHDNQRLLVQITKDPISSKGARLSTHIAIASRHLVYMPYTAHIGISQRIEVESERERLRELIAAARTELGEPAGFIARTAAESVDNRAIMTDLKLLSRIWRRVLEKRSAIDSPQCVYQEIPLHVRIVRDLAGPTLSVVRIDEQQTYERVKEYVDEFMPEVADRVQRYADARPLFERFGLDDELARALHKKVALRCGGYLIIEQTEAMVTIDVNTGGYLGGDNLEETVYRTNLEAAQAIPRQLRLRNLGGIIVIDFIDMSDPEHQRQVLRALEKACQADPARMRIEGFSSLGLVQMSRKRTRVSLVQQMCEPCARCDGMGYVATAQTTCIEIFRAISQDAVSRCRPGRPGEAGPVADGGEYLIRAPEAVVDRLLDEDADQLANLGRIIGRDVRIQVEPSYGSGQFDLVLVQGVRR